MKVKTTELTGVELNYAVAIAEGERAELNYGDVVTWKTVAFNEYRFIWKPSTEWSQGGPIIQRENINVFMDDERWAAYASHSLPMNFYGGDSEYDIGSPLVAAMRCYVASKLGEEVDIPDEFIQDYEDPSDFVRMGWVDSRGRP
jgi:hypothetical protein